MKKISFIITHQGEMAAGILPFTDKVEVTVASADPGGDPGEFETFMIECLSEWFDGAAVEIECKHEWIDIENKVVQKFQACSKCNSIKI